MRAHLVAFESPVPKLYDFLPPPVEDLDDVLAILFTGPVVPTTEEFKRTPVLVRRAAVREALEWLVLNHSDYADVGISDENLSKYPEDMPLVSVIYKESLMTKVPEGISVHDNGDEEGIDVGECPFIVHGLTGDQMGTESVEKLKGIAMNHWNSGGRALRVGHMGTPESIYKNPELYPQMFPWLFPYGLGGIGSTGRSDDAHKKHLLMYHDKRFQNDVAFPFAAFSHRQIKASNTGGYLLADKTKFHDITERLLNVNQDVLADISKRMAQGEVVKPVTQDEKNCFQIIRDLDHIGGKVDGSVTSKKYMRNEIWSLVANQGAPSWYITLSPADICNPICLYFADSKEKFEPDIIRSSDERFRLISKNPVAAARFFDFMVKQFIEHVLGFSSDHSGLYGDTAAYYGTVEQQGRLTLHLHLLLWIRNGLTPDEARQAIMDPTSPFQRSLVQYLEAAHQGEFCTGTMDEVRGAVATAEEAPGYKKPTETLPEAPPDICLDGCTACDRCMQLKSWWSRFMFTVDDILLRSNVHTCRSNINKDGTQNKQRQYAGCLDNDRGTCRGRFPRPLFQQTEVDPATGSLNIKKLEGWINTVSAPLTYLFRCNTDVTSLRSGTAIKGVMYYVTKYVTKTSLKTHVIFDVVRSIFHKNTEILGGSAPHQEKARSLMTKIVNLLGVKMEMGSPMICMYLLGNPDHYTSHKFQTFYWQSYVSEVLSAWPDDTGNSNRLPEKVMLIQRNGRVVGLSPVYDYIYRSADLESMSLYDWISQCTRIKGEPAEPTSTDQDVSDDLDDAAVHEVEHQTFPEGGGAGIKKRHGEYTVHRFEDGHPLASTHNILCVYPERRSVPNLVGQALPRHDRGDREYYCTTMLTLFKPWRSGLDLRGNHGSWEEAFLAANFSLRHQTYMKNFNIQYECMDAQDDFHAQLKKGNNTAHLPSWMNLDQSFIADSQQDQQIDDYTYDEGAVVDDESLGISENVGKRYLRRDAIMRDMVNIVNSANWGKPQADLLPEDTDLTPEPPSLDQPGTKWKASVVSARAAILDKRTKNIPADKPPIFWKGADPNVVEVVDRSYLEKKCQTGKWKKTISRIALDFQLNKEQHRAYSIVANHAVNLYAEPLKMYIAGMGGTGKSQVLQALIKFFEARGETHRFVVVAPTGTAAALLGGSTYHYMFGISDMYEQTKNQLSQVKSRLTGVDYVFFDEVSMLSCNNLYQISARLAQVLGNPEIPFGGMNMIFAGDFAQLPPVMGGEDISLYSRKVGTKGNKLIHQQAAIGKALWHQVTVVVILRKNMRQTHNSVDDRKLCTALENMRYKVCTPGDLVFLRSLQSSDSLGRQSVTEKQFRNVSIITSFNADKDAINMVGSKRFAAETNQTLTDFFSEDLVTPPEAVEERAKRKAAGNKTKVKKQQVSVKVQKDLWDAPHSSNSNIIPGKLSLCIGMPVMIRLNSATELCITRGQEGYVHSWQSAQGARGQRILDTLFVRLKDPPKKVQLPALPENVVPLTKTTVGTVCVLPDDSSLNVSRTQVEVLPNFSMTEYASQGKTREWNVVHISNCASHHAMYTSLSRGICAKGTITLQGFSQNIITGGASGALRQEFRELELLDDITSLRYVGKLPKGMHDAGRRNTLIDSFRACKGLDYMPLTVAAAIRWDDARPFLPWVLEDVDWMVLTKASEKAALQPKKQLCPCKRHSSWHPCRR
ncbi:hypothetical protein D9615_010738 [Tricholomella constricta]|uniref:ATP-dependent DNA helicase n=1 Tax=Tricholomella constricta TaxID=117010 RepID=A0A8H5LQQ7_9AGAR|nr:hypothetical protein D9615_010738 [Tricholomella constricta]